MFDDSQFKKINYGDVDIYQLEADVVNEKTGKTNAEVQMLLRWLNEGIFAALDQEYLESIIFAIYTEHPRTKEDLLLERYEFTLGYVDHNADGNSAVLPSINNIPLISKEGARTQAKKLMKSLKELCDTFDKLPDKKFLSIMLKYNKNAPEDYQPSCFMHTDITRSTFINNISSHNHINVGSLDPNHIQLSVHFQGLESFDTQELCKIGVSASATESLHLSPRDDKVSVTSTTTKASVVSKSSGFSLKGIRDFSVKSNKYEGKTYLAARLKKEVKVAHGVGQEDETVTSLSKKKKLLEEGKLASANKKREETASLLKKKEELKKREEDALSLKQKKREEDALSLKKKEELKKREEDASSLKQKKREEDALSLKQKKREEDALSLKQKKREEDASLLKKKEELKKREETALSLKKEEELKKREETASLLKKEEELKKREEDASLLKKRQEERDEQKQRDEQKEEEDVLLRKQQEERDEQEEKEEAAFIIEAKKKLVVFEESTRQNKISKGPKPCRVAQVDPKTNNRVRIYNSAVDAAKMVKLSVNSINDGIKRRVVRGGFKWEKVEELPPINSDSLENLFTGSQSPGDQARTDYVIPMMSILEEIQLLTGTENIVDSERETMADFSDAKKQTSDDYLTEAPPSLVHESVAISSDQPKQDVGYYHMQIDELDIGSILLDHEKPELSDVEVARPEVGCNKPKRRVNSQLKSETKRTKSELVATDPKNDVDKTALNLDDEKDVYRAVKELV